jgi:DNA-binding transcriptional regulator YdaS (Cro superfamily)
MKLRQYLEINGLKHSFFAERLGVNAPNFAGWVSGKCKPRLETILLIEKLTKGKVAPKDWVNEDIESKEQSQNKEQQQEQNSTSSADLEKSPEKPFS